MIEISLIIEISLLVSYFHAFKTITERDIQFNQSMKFLNLSVFDWTFFNSLASTGLLSVLLNYYKLNV